MTGPTSSTLETTNGHAPTNGALAGGELSSILAVDPRQTVVTTGPYRTIRHPMYTGTVLMGLATPLVLGSIWATLLIPPGWTLLVARILAEERLLSVRLPGYAEYISKTRTRLIPGIW